MDNKKIAEHIIALERNALAECCKGNPTPYLELFAPEITFFNTLSSQQWNFDDVHDAFERIRNVLDVDNFEMISHKVQIHGDMAVLTYVHSSSNLAFNRNCTEVYHRFPSFNDAYGEWKIIHSHWSDVYPKH